MREIEEAIRGLSEEAECALVLLLAFGWFALSSVLSVVGMVLGLAPSPGHAAPAISERGLIGLLGYEAVIILLLGWFLSVRGWTLKRIGFEASWRWTAAGVGIALGVYLLNVVVASLAAVSSIGPVAAERSAHLVAGGISLGPILAASVLNPVFEELFVCGYLITVLMPARGFWFAVNGSAGLRLVYHLYQGPLAVLYILPVGLIFAVWFARTRRLWPLVVAHAMFDLLGLIARQ